MNQKTLSIRKYYYGRTYILLEIVKLARHRELTLLQNKEHCVPVRHINAGLLDILKKNFEEFRFLEKDYNLYYGLAHLNGAWGVFSFNPLLRKKQQAEFKRNFKNFFIGYELGIDFDGNAEFNKDLMYYDGKKVTIEKKYYGKEGIDFYDINLNGKIKKKVKSEKLTELSKQEQIERARNDLLILKKEMDAYEINYSVRYTGSKGFHLNVDDKNFPDISPQKKVLICDKLTKEFSDILNLPTIDTRLCQDVRVWKQPYSLVGENVALPLDDNQINNFKLDDMHALTVISKIQIKGRGLLERNNDLPTPHQRKNFVKLLKDYEVKV